jgi:hypothetical protein
MLWYNESQNMSDYKTVFWYVNISTRGFKITKLCSEEGFFVL